MDARKSAAFYGSIFGWKIEPQASFEAPGLIGQWVADRPPVPAGGLLAWIAVDDVARVLQLVTANGGAVLEPPSRDAPLLLATIRDPGGNALGIAQHGPD